MTQKRAWLGAAAITALLAGCEGAVVENRFDELAKRETVFGEDSGGLGGVLFGGDDARQTEGQGGPAVNAFLWRAALDTISFFPLSSADPFGGVIITDWYGDTPNATERFKVNVVILTQDLTADGVSARVFRQVLDNSRAEWVDASVDPNTPAKLENAILQRARELRISSIQ